VQRLVRHNADRRASTRPKALDPTDKYLREERMHHRNSPSSSTDSHDRVHVVGLVRESADQDVERPMSSVTSTDAASDRPRVRRGCSTAGTTADASRSRTAFCSSNGR